MNVDDSVDGTVCVELVLGTDVDVSVVLIVKGGVTELSVVLRVVVLSLVLVPVVVFSVVLVVAAVVVVAVVSVLVNEIVGVIDPGVLVVISVVDAAIITAVY